MNNGNFTGKSVIITGASSGIGKALALRLSGGGAKIALAARNVERLELLAIKCRELGGKIEVIPTDVTKEHQCRELIQRTKAAFGHIDMLINNAGMSVVAKFDELKNLDLFRHVMEVNFYGALYCCYYALADIVESTGRIVNISSMGGLLALPYNSSYIASKFALQGFSDSLRMEVISKGVSVTVVSPYWVVTEFHEHYLDKDGIPKGPSGRAIYDKKMMTADVCAEKILKAALKRKRELLMGPGRTAVLLRWIGPSILEKITISTVMKRIENRLSKT